MLSKQYRLKNTKAFSATYKNHSTIGNKYVVVYKGRQKEDEETPTRVGFVVSKKYHKRAVKRNRVKRIYREAYRILLKEQQIEASQKYLSLVFVIKQDSIELDFHKCYKMLLKLLSL